MTTIIHLKSDLSFDIPHQINDDVIILIPAIFLSFFSLQLPTANQQQIQTAIPFALEDQLSQDIDELHFVYSKNKNDFDVAVIDKDVLKNAIEKIENSGIVFNKIIPDVLALPIEENSWSIALLENIVLVRTHQNKGFAIEHNYLNEILLCELQNQENIFIKKINIYNLTNHSLSLDFLPENIKEKVHEKSCSNHMELFQQGLHASPTSINLLQGEFRQSKKSHELRKIWGIAAIGFSVWIFAIFINLIFSNIILSFKESHLNSEISKVYYQIFPDAKSVIAPKIRVSQKLASVQSVASDQGFLELLGQSGKVISSFKNVNINSASYNNNALTIEIITDSFSNLSLISEKFLIAGLKATQTKATQQNNHVIVEYRILL